MEPTNYLATNTYLYDVYWYEGCESTVSEIDTGNPIPHRPDISCASSLENDYVQCRFLPGILEIVWRLLTGARRRQWRRWWEHHGWMCWLFVCGWRGAVSEGNAIYQLRDGKYQRTGLEVWSWVLCHS